MLYPERDCVFCGERPSAHCNCAQCKEDHMLCYRCLMKGLNKGLVSQDGPPATGEHGFWWSSATKKEHIMPFCPTREIKVAWAITEVGT
jgi:hypothetical protein